jgi:hypothetical protein
MHEVEPVKRVMMVFAAILLLAAGDFVVAILPVFFISKIVLAALWGIFLAALVVRG